MAAFNEPFKITDEGLCLGLVISSKTIPFDKITGVRRVPFWTALLRTMHPFRPPVFFPQGRLSPSVVLVDTEKLTYALHPLDEDRFVRLLSDRIKPQPGTA